MVLAAAIFLLLALGAGTAYAYVTSSGSGTGSTTAAPELNVTITTNAAPAGLLQPNGVGDLVITAPNNYSVQITALTLGTVTGCTTPAVSLVSPSTSYLPLTIPNNVSSDRLVIHGALTMGAGASNDCQNASLTVPLTATVRR
jgi:hypothetical protein